jgi:hypothetical protein
MDIVTYPSGGKNVRLTATFRFSNRVVRFADSVNKGRDRRQITVASLMRRK